MSSESADEYKDIQNLFLQTLSYDTGDKNKSYEIVNSQLGMDALAYIMRQLHKSARLGKLNFQQYSSMLEDAEAGLFKLIYVKHYIIGEDVIDIDPVWVSCRNLMRNLYTRVLNGSDQDLYKHELETKRPIQINTK